MPASQPHVEGDPDFVYVVYIAAPPDRIWAALTDGASVRPWWGDTRHDTDFRPGSPIRYLRDGKIDVEGEILEAEPHSRLVYTFHVTGPGPQHDEGPTLVEHRIEVDGAWTRLTIIHSNFKKNSAVRAGVSKGWPAILSKLKTMLEGGPAAASLAESSAR